MPDASQEEEKKSSSPRRLFQSAAAKEAPLHTHAFQDSNLTITPVLIASSDEKDLPCYSYLCVPKQMRGKFIPKKALDLGCQPAQHFKILNEGNPVTLPDGTIVYPFQVSEDQVPSQAVVLMFLPNENYIDNLLTPAKLLEFAELRSDQIDT